MSGIEITAWFIDLLVGGGLFGYGFYRIQEGADMIGWCAIISGLGLLAAFIFYGPDIFLGSV
ncbi:hypothetical protein ACFL9T_01420 [Thermodesulfobacteriota bacterium]